MNENNQGAPTPEESGSNVKTIVSWVVVIVVIALGFYLLTSDNNSGAPEENNDEENGEVMEDGVLSDEEMEAMMDEMMENYGENVVLYTKDGFSPQEITIKEGESVAFVNKSNRGMWVGSAMHPTHVVYGGTTLSEHCPDEENDDFDQCQAVGQNGSWIFTFEQAGEHGYHNHVGSNHWGRVIVE